MVWFAVLHTTGAADVRNRYKKQFSKHGLAQHAIAPVLKVWYTAEEEAIVSLGMLEALAE